MVKLPFHPSERRTSQTTPYFLWMRSSPAAVAWTSALMPGRGVPTSSCSSVTWTSTSTWSFSTLAALTLPLVCFTDYQQIRCSFLIYRAFCFHYCLVSQLSNILVMDSWYLLVVLPVLISPQIKKSSIQWCLASIILLLSMGILSWLLPLKISW